jgi:hypothetical protein
MYYFIHWMHLEYLGCLKRMSTNRVGYSYPPLQEINNIDDSELPTPHSTLVDPRWTLSHFSACSVSVCVV